MATSTEETVQERESKRLKRWIITGSVILAVFILLWVFFNFAAALFTALFLLILALRVDARIILIIALALLVTCPFLLVMQQSNAASRLAEFSYYFLAVGVFLYLVEHVRYMWRSQDEALGPDRES